MASRALLGKMTSLLSTEIYISDINDRPRFSNNQTVAPKGGLSPNTPQYLAIAISGSGYSGEMRVLRLP